MKLLPIHELLKDETVKIVERFIKNYSKALKQGGQKIIDNYGGPLDIRKWVVEVIDQDYYTELDDLIDYSESWCEIYNTIANWIIENCEY